MHGCMSERVICNHPRADGRIAVLLTCTVAVVHEVKVRSTGRQGVRRRKRNIRKRADYVALQETIS